MTCSPENPIDIKNPLLYVSEKLLKIKGYYLNIDIASVLDEEPDALYCPLVNCNMKRRILKKHRFRRRKLVLLEGDAQRRGMVSMRDQEKILVVLFPPSIRTGPDRTAGGTPVKLTHRKKARVR